MVTFPLPGRPRRVGGSGPRGGIGGATPTTYVTGYLYAGLGYTTVNEAAVPILSARHTHEELRDTPIVDKASCVLLANNAILLELIEKGELERARQVTGWNIWAAKAYGVKAVNPGGVAAWRWGQDAKGLFEPVPGYARVTPAMIISALAGIVDGLGLPHPLHLHCNRLGAPRQGRDSPARYPAHTPWRGAHLRRSLQPDTDTGGTLLALGAAGVGVQGWHAVKRLRG